MNFPDWYIEEKERARLELKDAKKAKYGLDLSLEEYQRKSRKLKKGDNLSVLNKPTQERIESVGLRIDERERSGSHLQQDNFNTYLSLLPKGVVVMDTDEAIRKFPWLKERYFKIMPKHLNKYTTFVNAYSKGGVFVWVKEGTQLELPLQSCFYLQTSNYVQVPHNFIIAEPHSRIHLITGCASDKECRNSAHIAVTEVFVGEGAEVTYTMIHNWGKNCDVRPNMGIKVEKGGTYISNYLLTSEVKSIQMYPTAVLSEDARANFNSMLFCRGKSQIDIGSAIYFNGKETKGEIKSRALILDKSDVSMRGRLVGNKRCQGHLECRGLILSDGAKGKAYPDLSALKDAELTHEAAIGKIRDEELTYLMTRGFSRDESASMVSRGFISLDIPGLPPTVNRYIKEIIELTTKKSIYL